MTHEAAPRGSLRTAQPPANAASQLHALAVILLIAPFVDSYVEPLELRRAPARFAVLQALPAAYCACCERR